MPFPVVLIDDRLPEGGFVFRAPFLSLTVMVIAANGRQHTGRLLAAHDGNTGIRPQPQKTRTEGASAHPVIPSAKRTSNDHSELGHISA